MLWDLDGTIVDSIGLIVASYQHAFTTVLGHPWDEAEIKSWIGQSLYGAMQKASPEHADEIFAEYTAWNEANTERMLHAYPGMPELVHDLARAGVRQGIVTSKRAEPAHWALRLAGIDDVMPLLVSHNDVEEHKPSPKPLLLGAAKLDAPLDACVYIGDAAVDVEAARNAGMATIAVTWGAGTAADIAAARPDLTCDDVAELRAALFIQ
ncbi:MAG: HAD-IA family hydrolase [Propionibacteriaceae bacterium]|nr:HAD-IA family hydrolase [Micropruina sp.]HBX80883.1 HAD family hydrolase [Propionibacteriaceae bacterium]HBY23552.1 HAD family hydrolase [Propionibacteriaceae bacterium]